MTTTFRLSKPLKTHEGDISELKLKTPQTRLITRHGDPFTIRPFKNGNGEVDYHAYVYDNRSMLAFASDMSGLDTLTLEALPVADFMSLRNKIREIILDEVPDRSPSEQSAS